MSKSLPKIGEKVVIAEFAFPEGRRALIGQTATVTGIGDFTCYPSKGPSIPRREWIKVDISTLPGSTFGDTRAFVTRWFNVVPDKNFTPEAPAFKVGDKIRFTEQAFFYSAHRDGTKIPFDDVPRLSAGTEHVVTGIDLDRNYPNHFSVKGYENTSIAPDCAVKVEPATLYRRGDEVEVFGYSDAWDGPAVVVEHSLGIVSVRPDGGPYAGYLGGFNPKYIRPLVSKRPARPVVKVGDKVKITGLAYDTLRPEHLGQVGTVKSYNRTTGEATVNVKDPLFPNGGYDRTCTAIEPVTDKVDMTHVERASTITGLDAKHRHVMDLAKFLAGDK